MKTVRIGVIGCGTVGNGVVKALLAKRGFIRNRIGIDLVLVRVCDTRFSRAVPKLLRRGLAATDYAQVVSDPSIDIIVELVGGTRIARQVVEKALAHGKSVVTANKALLANYGRRLFSLAKKNGVGLYFEASVGAGIPIVKSLRESFGANTITTMQAIINGTSNYILSKMGEEGCSLEAALRQAQRLGFAESDPTLDISGYDSTHKLAILVLLAFGRYVAVDQIFTEGIERIDLQDIQYAREMGYVVKLLAIAKMRRHRAEVRVHPTLLSERHLLANVRGVLNAVYLKGDLFGESLLYGEGAGEGSAASGVLSDVLDAAGHRAAAYTPSYNYEFGDARFALERMETIRSRYYIRITAIDKPGVLAKIAGILGRCHISIASVSQKEHCHQSAVPVVMMTHEAREQDVNRALALISGLSAVKCAPVAIRVED